MVFCQYGIEVMAAPTTAKKRVNYLNNRDMLMEIHKSKSSYCSFVDPDYHKYDTIVYGELGDAAIEAARASRAKKIGNDLYATKKAAGEKVKLADCLIDPESIKLTDLIFRVMTYDHIPLSDRKRIPKSISEQHVKLNFPPFQHFKYNEDGELVCVGKSHWRGDVTTGKFDVTTGAITNNLALMLMELCDRFSTKRNIRSYSYNDEMRGHAILQLTYICLQFDEGKSNNPFSYFTASVTNSTIRILNIEKRHQNVRDDILEMNDLAPSFTRSSGGEFLTSMKKYFERQERNERNSAVVDGIKNQYKDNEEVLGHIDWFTSHIQSNQILVWYTDLLDAYYSKNQSEYNRLLGITIGNLDLFHIRPVVIQWYRTIYINNRTRRGYEQLTNISYRKMLMDIIELADSVAYKKKKRVSPRTEVHFNDL